MGLTRTGPGSCEQGPSGALSFEPAWFVATDCDEEEQRSLAQRIFGTEMRCRDLGPATSAPFGCRMMLRMQPDLGLMCCFAPPAHWRLGPGAFGAHRDVVLVRPADGTMTVVAGRRRAFAAGRSAVVVDGRSAATFQFAGTTRVDCCVLPRGSEAADERYLAALVMRPVPAGNDALQLFGHYGAAVLRGLLPLPTAELRRMATEHLCGLVAEIARTIDEPGTATPSAGRRRRSRLDAIKMEVELRISRRDLNAELIAALHRVSPRYVQKLFEAEGRTFSQYVLERRLERARQVVATTRPGERTIADIAYEAGFGDLSYFNRAFRARFGCSPSAARRALQARTGLNLGT